MILLRGDYHTYMRIVFVLFALITVTPTIAGGSDQPITNYKEVRGTIPIVNSTHHLLPVSDSQVKPFVFNSIQNLYTACKAPGYQPEAMECLVYIAGIMGLMSSVGEVLPRVTTPESRAALWPLAICNHGTYGAAKQAFLNWAEKHPEWWQNPPALGVQIAVRDLWPCTSK